MTAGHFAAGNRDTLWGVYRYTYDLDGNRLTADSAGTTIAAYTWSAMGRLLKVKRGTDSVEYAYNALGELVRRKTDGVTDRHFLWDNGQLLALLDGSGQRIAEYAYLPSGEPLSYTTSGGTDYYHVDLRGNVVGVSTGTAAVQQTNYAPWGAVENQSGYSFDSTRLGWKGNVWEGGKTNLYYVRNRWYDPASRGFISEDPIGIAGGLNTYAYAGNDPVNGDDPSGTTADADPTFACVEFSDRTVCINTGDGGGSGTASLPPVVTTAPWTPSGPPITSLPALPSGPAGHGAGSGGRGRGSTKPGDNPLAKLWQFWTSDCGIATANLLVTAGSDLAFFTGVGEVTKVGLVALKEARLAGMFARGAAMGLAHTAAARADRLAMYGAAAAVGRDYWGAISLDSGNLSTAGMSGGLDLSDFLPGFATRNAWNERKAACGQE